MPLLVHVHPPLFPPRRWEEFHHAWASAIAHQLNQDVLPREYFAEPEISLGPEMEIDVATLHDQNEPGAPLQTAVKTWTPTKSNFSVAAEYSRPRCRFGSLWI